MTGDIVTLTVNPALDLSTSVSELMPFSKLRCHGEQRDPGGGGINVARVVQRFGAEPLAVYPAGGPIGDYLARLVAAEGIESVIIPIAGHTRENLTVTETKSGQQFRFVLAGPQLAESEWKLVLHEFSIRLSRGSLAVASGSLPAGVPDDFYARAAQIANDAGARLMLDCSSALLRVALHTGLYLIKPNLRELCGLTGQALPDQASWIAACRGLIASGSAELVALSLAEQGALLVSRDFALRADSPQVTVLTSVGAGDSFLGALVWALSDGQGLHDAFRCAVAAGAAALLSPGTGLCQIANVEKLIEYVRIREVG